MEKKLFGSFINMLFPPKCAACGEICESGEVLCADCLSKYTAEVREACPLCGKTADLCRCAGGALPVCIAFYKSYYSSEKRVTEKILFSLKHRRNVPLADFFARDLASALLKRLAAEGEAKESYILTYLPRSEKNLRKYGFDHGKLLCSRISRYSGIMEADLFERRGGREQKKMNYAERTDNAVSTLALSAKAEVKMRRIILVDDIITTGATVNRAAELLYSRGAEKVLCAVIAKTSRKVRKR